MKKITSEGSHRKVKVADSAAAKAPREQIQASEKTKADGRVYKQQAKELVKGWSARQVSEAQAQELKDAVNGEFDHFTRDAQKVAREFLDVTLPKLTVQEASLVGLPRGSTIITWTSPTRNTDGTALTDLVGYKLLYGTSPTNLNKVMNIRDANANRVQVNNLSSGQWYFAMKAVAGSGESARTNLASTMIP